MPTLDHLHNYERIGKTKRYKCTHPDCSHITTLEMIKGKRATCARCLESFVINTNSLRRKTLWCANTDCPNLKPRNIDKDSEAQDTVDFANLINFNID